MILNGSEILVNVLLEQGVDTLLKLVRQLFEDCSGNQRGDTPGADHHHQILHQEHQVHRQEGAHQGDVAEVVLHLVHHNKDGKGNYADGGTCQKQSTQANAQKVEDYAVNSAGKFLVHNPISSL